MKRLYSACRLFLLTSLLLLLWPASSDSAEPLAPIILHVPPNWTSSEEGYFLNDDALQGLVADAESWEETTNAWMTAYYEMFDRHIAYVSDTKDRMLVLMEQINKERAGWLAEIKRLRGNGLYLYGGGEYDDGKFGTKVGAMFVWRVF